VKPFQILQPASVDEASSMLAAHGDAAKAYAGGTELLLVMKEGLAHYDTLVDLKTIPGLDAIEVDAARGALRIGALATHRAIEKHPGVAAHLPVFARAWSRVANIRVRSAGTIGGNLCFAEPHADPGTLLLLLDARATLARRGVAREVPLSEFFVGSFETALAPDEILTRIDAALPGPDTALAYEKFAFLERPSVGVGVSVRLDAARGIVEETRIAVGCVGPTPRRMADAEEILAGVEAGAARERIEAAGAAAASVSDAISDLHGSAEYKTHLVRVLARRAFVAALDQLRPELAVRGA
jgi:carbon-monoxide dehydrogenase medium subunit